MPGTTSTTLPSFSHDQHHKAHAAKRKRGLIPVLGSQPAGDRSHKPGSRLPLLSVRPFPRWPPQLPSVTAHWPVPNYTAWWQRHMCKHLAQGCTQSRDRLIASHNHLATSATRRRCRFWHATQDCVAPYVDHILHRDRYWAISIACEIVGYQILPYGAQPCDAGPS